MKLFKSLSLLIPLLLFVTLSARAQNEVMLEQATLQGINGFYVSVNVEGNKELTKYDTLNVTKMQRDVENKLRDAGLPLQQEAGSRQGQDYPMLYIHVNVMDAGRGLIPFAVDVKFYQPVKLTLNRDIQTAASTWSSGYLGLVSYDRLGVIRQSMLSELENFIREFNSANR